MKLAAHTVAILPAFAVVAFGTTNLLGFMLNEPPPLPARCYYCNELHGL